MDRRALRPMIAPTHAVAPTCATAATRAMALLMTASLSAAWLTVAWLAPACLAAGTDFGERPGTADPNVYPASPIDSAPAPGDYDGDGATDIALKGRNGIFYLDLRANGFGGRWDQAHTGYGDETAIPVPADYDNDGRADLSVKGNDGF